MKHLKKHHVATEGYGVADNRFQDPNLHERCSLTLSAASEAAYACLSASSGIRRSKSSSRVVSRSRTWTPEQNANVNINDWCPFGSASLLTVDVRQDEIEKAKRSREERETERARQQEELARIHRCTQPPF